ncbi:hypothetical protein BpHYR1_049584 [Brachionus plicatilis]|uniref:Uncharacterized protein n=1 Tax=Brachionus plicatilis TaxID=10195 RepID=A0A3M7PBN3_BRAPC|nr:hypothetical protein BpHYR1_049584 [Brachionus plicatilis]
MTSQNDQKSNIKIIIKYPNFFRFFIPLMDRDQMTIHKQYQLLTVGTGLKVNQQIKTVFKLCIIH